MNLLKKVTSGAATAALLLTASPAFAYNIDNPIDASIARCNETSGREKMRCQSIHRRVERLRLRQTANTFQRGNTLREQRVLRRSTRTTNIRRINQYDQNRLRRHNRDGGNARRLINQRDEEARNACRALTGTEKFQCIRKNWRTMSRGQTR